MRGTIRPRPMPSAPFSSWTHIAITAFSKRGSPMPGMARSNWPERYFGSSIALRYRARLERPLGGDAVGRFGRSRCRVNPAELRTLELGPQPVVEPPVIEEGHRR